ARSELEGRIGGENEISDRRVRDPGDDPIDRVATAFGQEPAPEGETGSAEAAEEPCGGDGEGEQADRQGEHGFEEEVEPSAGVGGRGQQAAESLSLRTGGHLGDGSTPCPGTGPGQTPEGAGDGQGQW